MKTMRIDGKDVFFQREDGTITENTVGVGGHGPNGEILFYEILDKIDNAAIDGKLKYKRIIIKRVYPCIKA